MGSKVVRKKGGLAGLGGEKPRGVNKTLIADFPFMQYLQLLQMAVLQRQMQVYKDDKR